MRADLVMLFTCLAVVDWQVDHPPARCMNMLKRCCISRKSLLLSSSRVVQPLAWSVCSVCVAYARTSKPRVPRGPRRPPWHAWHRLARASLAGPAAASLPAIMAAPALAMGATVDVMGSHTVRIHTLFNVHDPTTRATSLDWQVDHPPAHCMNMLK